MIEDYYSSSRDPAICLLTSEHRDKWADAYAYLNSLSEVNRDSFDNIQSSLFALSLDDCSVELTETALASIVFNESKRLFF